MKSMLEKSLSLQTPRGFSHHLSEAEQTETIRPEALARYQTESLRAIIHRAYEKSEFYREKMDRVGITPGDIRQPADLCKLPFLTKDELRGKPWLLLTCDKRDVALIQVSTGTSGDEEIYMTYTWSDYFLLDLQPKYSKLFPVGSGDICLNALPYEMSTAGLAFHKTFMDGHQATVIPGGKGGAYSTAAKTIKMVKDLRPNIIATSPSWAILLSEEAARTSFDPTSLKLKKMWLTGEGCAPAFRRRVEQLWGTTANFFYGSLECGMLGIECDEHDGYHVPQAHVIIEIVDPATGQPVKDGDTGEIVVTALLRYDSPIIRFRTGDLGCLDTSPCACGATLARFRMKGRAFEQIKFRGRSVSPIYLEEFLMRMPEVGNWFEIVTPASDSHCIKVRCEPASGVQPASGLAEELAGRMACATGLPFEFEIVNQLSRPSGKVRRVVQA